MKCKFCGADVRIGEYCEYCRSYAEPSYYPGVYVRKEKTKLQPQKPLSKMCCGSWYVVEKGDSLWSIAKKFYGSGSEYRKIYDANREVIQDINIIHTGQEILIPFDCK